MCNNNILFLGDVVRKWNNLKTYFITESQKYYKTCKSGAATDDVENFEKSSWKYFEKLIYLKETCEAMPSINNYNKRSLNVCNFYSR